MRRSRIIQAIREYFIRNDFLEVETPMMQPRPGGAEGVAVGRGDRHPADAADGSTKRLAFALGARVGLRSTEAANVTPADLKGTDAGP